MTLKPNIGLSSPTISETRKGTIRGDGSDSSVECNFLTPLADFTSNPPSVSSDTDGGFNPGKLLVSQFE